MDEKTHSILIRNQIINLPDRIGIPLEQVVENLWDNYGTSDEGAKSTWEKTFDTQIRHLNEPIMNFLARQCRSSVQQPLLDYEIKNGNNPQTKR